MSNQLIYSATDLGSRRSVMVINEGDSIWTYLTAPSSTTPIGDCWMLNLVEAPVDLSAYRANRQVPPATLRFTSHRMAMDVPELDEISSRWSRDGEAVAVFIQGRVQCMLVAAEKTGYAVLLEADGPFGKPFDSVLYESLFGGGVINRRIEAGADTCLDRARGGDS